MKWTLGMALASAVLAVAGCSSSTDASAATTANGGKIGSKSKGASAMSATFNTKSPDPNSLVGSKTK